MEEAYQVHSKTSDSSTAVGIVFAFLLVFAAIYLGGNPTGFVDIRSILIVLLGTFAITVACFSFSDMMHSFKATFFTIFYRFENFSQAAVNAIRISDIARSKGFLELDKYEDLTRHNAFLQNGIEMIVDHIDIDEIERVLELEVASMAHRHAKSTAVLRKAAEISPAMGLIGTLIGLVQMLGNLEDTSTIGPAMAVALLTTFYGAVMSYMIFLPLASKLERNTKDELLIAEIYMQTIKSIGRRESPRKLEMIINSILPPIERVDYYELKKGAKKGKKEK